MSESCTRFVHRKISTGTYARTGGYGNSVRYDAPLERAKIYNRRAGGSAYSVSKAPDNYEFVPVYLTLEKPE